MSFRQTVQMIANYAACNPDGVTETWESRCMAIVNIAGESVYGPIWGERDQDKVVDVQSISDAPREVFMEELFELIDKWSNKPEDDKLSNGELVGCMEYVRLHYMLGSLQNNGINYGHPLPAH